MLPCCYKLDRSLERTCSVTPRYITELLRTAQWKTTLGLARWRIFMVVCEPLCACQSSFRIRDSCQRLGPLKDTGMRGGENEGTGKRTKRGKHLRHILHLSQGQHFGLKMNRNQEGLYFLFPHFRSISKSSSLNRFKPVQLWPDQSASFDKKEAGAASRVLLWHKEEATSSL